MAINTSDLISSLAYNDANKLSQQFTSFEINPQDSSELMFLAVKCGSISCTQVLIFHSVDINSRDEDGNTPLYWATTMGNEDMVRLLLEHGADPLLSNSNGVNAIDQAKGWNRVKILFLLRDYI